MVVLLSWLWTVFGVLSGETFLYLLIGKKAQNLSILGHLCLTTIFGFLSTALIMFVLAIFHLQSIYAYIPINLAVSLPGFYFLWKYPPHLKRDGSRRNLILNFVGGFLIIGFLIYMVIIIGQYNNITNGDAYFFIGQAIEIMHYKPNVLNQHFLGSPFNFFIGDFYLCIYLFFFDYVEAIMIIKYLPVLFSLIMLLGIYGFIRDTYQKPILGIVALIIVFATKVFSSYLFTYSRHILVLLIVVSFQFLLFKEEINKILVGIVMAVCIYLIHSPSLLLIGLGFIYYYVSTIFSMNIPLFTRIRDRFQTIFASSSNKRKIWIHYLVVIVVGYIFSHHWGAFQPLTLTNWNNLSMNAVIAFLSVGFAIYILFFGRAENHKQKSVIKTYAFFTLVLFFITSNIYWWNRLTGMPYTAIRYVKYYEFGLIFLLCPFLDYLWGNIRQWYSSHIATQKFSWRKLREQKVYLSFFSLGIILLSLITASSINLGSTYFIDEWSTKTPDGFIEVGNWMRTNTQNESIVLFPYEHFPRFHGQYQSIFFYDYFVLTYHYSMAYLQNDTGYKMDPMKYPAFIEWVYTGLKGVTEDSGICQMLLNNNKSFYSKIDYIILYTSYSPYLNNLMGNDTDHFQKIYEIEVVEQAYWLFYPTEYPPHLFQFVIYDVI